MLEIIGQVLLVAAVIAVAGIIIRKGKLLTNKEYGGERGEIKDSISRLSNSELSVDELKKIIFESTDKLCAKKSELIEQRFFENTTLKNLNDDDRILAFNLAKTGIKFDLEEVIISNLKNCSLEICSKMISEIKAVYKDKSLSNGMNMVML